MREILPQVETDNSRYGGNLRTRVLELMLSLKQLMPSIYRTAKPWNPLWVYFSLEKVMLFLIIVGQNQKVLSADFSITIIGQLVP